MTGPGGGYGHSGHDDDATRAAPTPQGAPWDPPPVDYPRTDHPAPGYPSYPAGYQQPGYGAPYPPPPPQYGAPPAGYPSYGGAYSAPAGTNGMAIASLVSSVAGIACCGIGAIVGLVLGIVALNQIKQTNQDGRGLAIAGIVIGGIGIAAGLVYFLFVLIGMQSR
jgi:hypothetical protein